MIQALPDLVEPSEMLGLHHDGTEASDGACGVAGEGVRWEEAEWKAGESEMKVEASGLVEDTLGKSG